MKIWIYSVILLLPALWTGRCLQGLIAKQPCRGACTGSAVSLVVLVLVFWRYWVVDILAGDVFAFPKDWSFLETTAGTLVMGGGIFLVVAGLLFLIARRLR
jgi:hypothetical protein